ncbi:MAG: winged helix-turn-helix domain-containing protein [Blastocatellales bacterium]
MSVPSSSTTSRLYVFGPFRLDVAERSLQCSGVAVPLPPKTFDTLVALVENSGRLMEKDELIRQLWPDSFVEDGSLARKISYLRKALEENDPERKYIETVPRIGYRFVAQVEAVALDAPVYGSATTALTAPRDFQLHGNGGAKTAATFNDATALAEPLVVHPSALRMNLVVAFVAIGLAAMAGLAYWLYSNSQTEAAPFQNRQTVLLTNSGLAQRQALSPDGKYLAYAMQEGAQQSLWVQQTATNSAVPIIAPAPVRYSSLTFSPDGNYVYFTHPGQPMPLFRVPTLGGQAVKLLDDVGSPPAFSPDGKQMAFVRRDSGKREVSLSLANVDGTAERRLAVRKLPNRFSPDGLSWSPDGRHIAIGVEDYDRDPRHMRVVAVQVADGKEIPLGAQQWYRVEQVAWTGDGKGVVAIAWDPPSGIFGGQLWRLPWPAGAAQRLTNDLNDYEGLSLAADGATLATIEETRASYFWVETPGKPGRAIEGLSAIGDPQSPHLGIGWLPGNRIVYGKTVGGNADLWAMDLDGRNQRRLTTSPEADIQPAVSADGATIVYTSFRGNHPHIWRMDADGKNQRRLTEGADETMPALSADGRWLFYLSTGMRAGNLLKLPLAGGAPAQVGNYVVTRPVLSPDGRWVAGFMADPTNDERSQMTILSVAGDAPPRTFFARGFFEQSWIEWSPDSRAIRYLDQQNGVTNLRSQPIDGSPSQPLTNFQNDLIFRFAFSPAGRALICERGKKARDVVLFKAAR